MILLFATYQPMRFSIEDPERQARYASVFAVVAGAFVPLNFIAVRLSAEYVHPRMLDARGRQPARLDGDSPSTSPCSGIALLFATLMKYEMAAKTARMEMRRLRRMLLGDDGVCARCAGARRPS